MDRIRKDSRKHPRVAVYLKAGVQGLAGLKQYHFCSYNISLGGMMLITTPPLNTQDNLQIGERVTLSFSVSPKAGVFNIHSSIVWIKDRVLTPENDEATCVGAQFINVPESVKSTISKFLIDNARELRPGDTKKTCRDCIHFKENPGSKYAFCKLHKITVLNSDEDLTLSFNQIYTYPCKDLKIKG